MHRHSHTHTEPKASTTKFTQSNIFGHRRWSRYYSLGVSVVIVCQDKSITLFRGIEYSKEPNIKEVVQTGGIVNMQSYVTLFFFRGYSGLSILVPLFPSELQYLAVNLFSRCPRQLLIWPPMIPSSGIYSQAIPPSPPLSMGWIWHLNSKR